MHSKSLNSSNKICLYSWAVPPIGNCRESSDSLRTLPRRLASVQCLIDLMIPLYHFPDSKQPLPRRAQRLLPFRKVEPDQVVYRFAEKAGTWHGGDPDLFRQP